MTNGIPMVPVCGVHKFSGDLHALRGINLDTAPGEVCVILDPLGLGKSIPPYCFNQLEEISVGRVNVESELLGYREGARGQLYEFPDRVIAS